MLARFVRLLVLGVLALALSAGCRRKAPGPEDCAKLALLAAGVTRRQDVRSPELLERVDTLTRECIVTPYDRTFVRCMEETRHFPACRRDFARRRAELTVR
jgi:hypothetical protein